MQLDELAHILLRKAFDLALIRANHDAGQQCPIVPSHRTTDPVSVHSVVSVLEGFELLEQSLVCLGHLDVPDC